MSDRLEAWIFFKDGKCDEDNQLFVDDIKALNKKLQAEREKVALLKSEIIMAKSHYNFDGCVLILEQALEKLEEREGNNEQ